MPDRHFIKNREELAAYITSLSRGLVAFDGRPGSGKTHLAEDMARRIGCKSADADRNFLDSDKGKFVGSLRLDEMRSSLTASLASAPLVMFSTVCARQASQPAMGSQELYRKSPPLLAIFGPGRSRRDSSHRG